MPTTYTDTFNRSAQLVGAVESGGATWQTQGTTPSTNGSYLYLSAAGQLAYLDTGVGDVDLSSRVIGSGAVAVRDNASDARQFRARLFGVPYSSGGYVTRTRYSATYNVTVRGNFPCESSMTLYEYQCNSSSFPSSKSGQCYTTAQQFVDYVAAFAGSRADGTCQVYESSSGTNYYVAFERVDAAGNVTELARVGTYSSPTLRVVAQGSTVTAYVDGTKLGQVADADATSRATGRHGLQGAGSFDTFSLTVLNTAPNAPLLRAPLNGEVVDRTAAYAFAWQFNDPDATDTQSAYELQLVNSSGTVTTYSGGTPQQQTVPAGLAAGDWQWRVRTTDSQGVVGAWSDYGYFSTATPPAAPVLTSLTVGQTTTVPVEQFLVTWTAAQQDAYQLQRLNAAGTTTLYDSGTVLAPTARSATLRFPTNTASELVRFRIRYGGLWSGWLQAAVTVSYTPPPQPSLLATAAPADAAIDVDVTCPAPIGTQPTSLSFDVYRSSNSGSEERIAAAVPAVQGSAVRVRDWLPVSGAPTRYRAVVYGSNGVTSSS